MPGHVNGPPGADGDCPGMLSDLFTRHPQEVAVGIVLDGGVVIFGSAGDVDIALRPQRHRVGCIAQSLRSVVPPEPDAVAVRVVLDSDVVVVGIAGYVDVAAVIHCDGSGLIKPAPGAIIAPGPLLHSFRIVLDC